MSDAAIVREPGCICTDASLAAKAGHECRCPLHWKYPDDAPTDVEAWFEVDH